MRFYPQIFSDSVMRFFAFCFFIFVVFLAIQLLPLKPPTHPVDFKLLVEPVEDEGNLPSSPGSFGTSINSFSWNSKRLKKYFHVSEVFGSLSKSFWEPSETDILFKFSLEAKQDVQGQIFANYYDTNGIFIQRIPVEESSGSTPLSVPDYLSSLTKGNTKGSFWQWRRKEKKQMFLKIARNTRKVELFFEESR